MSASCASSIAIVALAVSAVTRVGSVDRFGQHVRKSHSWSIEAKMKFANHAGRVLHVSWLTTRPRRRLRAGGVDNEVVEIASRNAVKLDR